MKKDISNESAPLPTHAEETAIAATFASAVPNTLTGPFGSPGELMAGAAMMNLLTPQDEAEADPTVSPAPPEEKA